MSPTRKLAQLIERNRQAAAALINGDIRGYLTHVTHADDYPSMPPTGGEARRGFDDSEEGVISALERYFRGGEADVEVVATYASGDLVVLVVVERQHGQVGGAPSPGLVAARDHGVPPARIRLAAGAPPCRSPGPRDQPGPLAVLARGQGSG